MSENITRIRVVANGLAPIGREFYFVGGSVASLYVDNSNVFEHRHTEDIDIVVEIISRGKYFKLQERLREIGFKEDSESSLICRWKYHGITVDIMPLSEEVLGFSNYWYLKGIQNAVEVIIDNEKSIKIFSYPYFLASKFEALFSRNVDWRYSKDFEDIIKTLEARSSSADEINESEEEVKAYIIKRIKELFVDDAFLTEAINAILYPNQDDQRIKSIIQKLENLSKLE